MVDVFICIYAMHITLPHLTFLLSILFLSSVRKLSFNKRKKRDDDEEEWSLQTKFTWIAFIINILKFSKWKISFFVPNLCPFSVSEVFDDCYVLTVCWFLIFDVISAWQRVFFYCFQSIAFVFFKCALQSKFNCFFNKKFFAPLI